MKNLFIPNFKQLRLYDFQNRNLNPRRCMAFSTENVTSQQLFSAFFQNTEDNNYYFIGCKTSNWGTAQFRPAPEQTTEKDIKISVFPNPTNDYIILQSNGNSNEVYQQIITDISGKILSNTKGNIESLNKNLKNLKLSAGVYNIQLKNENNKFYLLKAIKN